MFFGHVSRIITVFSLILLATAFAIAGTTPSYFTVAPTVAAPGQFIQFSWDAGSANTFVVTPSLLSEDETTLPLTAVNQAQVAPAVSTTYQATAVGAQANTAMTAPLTVVPVTIATSASEVPAGQPVKLTFTGPNNGSSFFLVTLPENSITPLVADSCGGNTCTGSYVSPALGSDRSFMIEADGPYGGQSYSQPVTVSVSGGMSLNCAATPVVPAPGQPVTISWSATNAASVRIDQGVGEVSPAAVGQVSVSPTQSTTYTCTATDRFGDQLSQQTQVMLSSGGIQNLNHTIFMLQENRAFDNYFGVFANYRVNIDHIPGAQMGDVNDLHTLPTNYTIKNPQGHSFGPFHQRTECIENLSPSWDETHYDMDLIGNDWLHLTQNSHYKMDRFLDTTLSGGSGDRYDHTHTRPLGYYDQSDLPFYYELAAQFATSDTWYSPIPANTIPNRMYLFAATSYGHAFPPGRNDRAWQRPTIFRALTRAGISWRYYYQDNSVFLASWADWGNRQIRNNVRNIQEYYNILASHTADRDLPQVVFIERPSATGYDEHPGNNIQKGAARARTVITALLGSGAWPDSAFILTFDEGGGLFDHVAPVLVTPPGDISQPTDLHSHDQHGMFNVTGFRVPVIVVSPWVKPHDVSHLPMDYTAILKLIETRFTVPALTQRDANAGNMADTQNGFFDFSSPHLLTVPALPTQPTNGTCNLRLESHP
ncbi:MAG TPA: alkaline phosphatase family protein [Candidatus Binatia bacterium]|nr:alkaline phosphatase family protein [Candidatus Binatia bacterium]